MSLSRISTIFFAVFFIFFLHSYSAYSQPSNLDPTVDPLAEHPGPSPQDPGFHLDSNGIPQPTLWVDYVTPCIPCRHWVAEYNQNMHLLFELKYLRAMLDFYFKFELADIERQIGPNPDLNNADQQTMNLLSQLNRVGRASTQSQEFLNEKIQELDSATTILGEEIRNCEAQCFNEGEEEVGNAFNPDEHIFSLQPNWQRPFQTQCEPCQSIADELNNLLKEAFAKLKMIRALELRVELLQETSLATQEIRDEFAARSGIRTGRNRDQMVRELEGLKQTAQSSLDQIDEDIRLLEKQLQDCEQENCPSEEGEGR